MDSEKFFVCCQAHLVPPAEAGASQAAIEQHGLPLIDSLYRALTDYRVIRQNHCGLQQYPHFTITCKGWSWLCHRSFIFRWCPALTGPMTFIERNMRRFDTRLDLDDAETDVDRSEVHEILTWIYHFDEMRILGTCPFRGSMICAWNSMILPENITIGVLMVHHNVPREQSLEFLTTKAREMCARFSADSVQQRVKSLQWAQRIYSHKWEGFESLREAVIGGLRPSHNEVVQMVEGRMLIDSNEEFRRDLKRDLSSDEINDGGSGKIDEDIAKLTMEKAVEVDQETRVDRD